jgi:hypothetical protein
MLRIADLERDAAWLDTVRDTADRLLAEDPATVAASTARWFPGAAQFLGA